MRPMFVVLVASVLVGAYLVGCGEDTPGTPGEPIEAVHIRPSWSGELIAYHDRGYRYVAGVATYVPEERVIRILDLGDGSTKRSCSGYDPDLSSSGSGIAFEYGGHIYIDTLSVECTDARYVIGGSRPAWSRNGRYLAYDKYDAGVGDYSIWIYDSAEGTSRRVGSNETVGGTQPTWAPGDSALVFVQRAVAGSGSVSYSLFTIALRDTKAVEILEADYELTSPSCSSRGVVLFAMADVSRGVPNVYCVGLDGGEAQRITESGGADPDWNDEGTGFVYVKEGDGASGEAYGVLWVYDMNTMREQQITYR